MKMSKRVEIYGKNCYYYSPQRGIYFHEGAPGHICQVPDARRTKPHLTKGTEKSWESAQAGLLTCRPQSSLRRNAGGCDIKANIAGRSEVRLQFWSSSAALAVLIATLWMPVLRIYGSSMSPTLQDGQIVVSIKSSRFEPGDIAAFYHGNKLLIKRYIAGPGQWVDIDENGNVFVDRVAAGRTVSYGKGLRPNQHRTAVSGAGRAIFPAGRQPRRIR